MTPRLKSDRYGAYELYESDSAPTHPAVSVLMAIHNGGADVQPALDAVRDQTFTDWELVVVDDGSTDGTFARLHIAAGQEARIRLIRQDNLGLTRSLNRGLQETRGEFVARQDVDDRSRPERLARQVAAFRQDSRLVLLAGRARFQGDGGAFESSVVRDSEIRTALPRYNPIQHSSVMFRRETMIAAGGYDDSFVTSQDFEAWNRLSHSAAIRMLDDVLVDVGLGSNAISRKRHLRQCYDSFRVRARNGRLPSAVVWTARQFLAPSLGRTRMNRIRNRGTR